MLERKLTDLCEKTEYSDRKVVPEIQKQLKEADTRLHYCVCPKCGFTSDD